jgi:hypothetical protein
MKLLNLALEFTLKTWCVIFHPYEVDNKAKNMTLSGDLRRRGLPERR